MTFNCSKLWLFFLCSVVTRNNHWISKWHSFFSRCTLMKIVYVTYLLFSLCHLIYKMFRYSSIEREVCLQFYHLMIGNNESSEYPELQDIGTLYSMDSCGITGFISDRLSTKITENIQNCVSDSNSAENVCYLLKNFALLLHHLCRTCSAEVRSVFCTFIKS